jgi:hypothetical protein
LKFVPQKFSCPDLPELRAFGAGETACVRAEELEAAQ